MYASTCLNTPGMFFKNDFLASAIIFCNTPSPICSVDTPIMGLKLLAQPGFEVLTHKSKINFFEYFVSGLFKKTNTTNKKFLRNAKIL